MKFFNSVVAEMRDKYKQDILKLKIVDMPKVLNTEDWKKLKSAMKYPNGSIRGI